jgi:hypothetical protein
VVVELVDVVVVGTGAVVGGAAVVVVVAPRQVFGSEFASHASSMSARHAFRQSRLSRPLNPLHSSLHALISVLQSL